MSKETIETKAGEFNGNIMDTAMKALDLVFVPSSWVRHVRDKDNQENYKNAFEKYVNFCGAVVLESARLYYCNNSTFIQQIFQ